MKKTLAVLILLLAITGTAYANHFNAVKESNDFKITVSINSNPLKVGDNDMTVQLLNRDGEYIADQDVTVYYFMPSMPAMNYEVKTTFIDNRYTAVIKPVMPGTWDADIIISKGTNNEQKVTISFEAK